jgi:hypothetical protein
MERKRISLEIHENSKLTRISQILFGIICIIISAYWIVFNIKAVKTDGTLWITIIFLIGFGVFQVLSGWGFTAKFIDLSDSDIRLKRNSFLPPVEIKANQIEKIDLYPLSLIFLVKPSKKILLRLGVTYPERIELIKKEIVNFAELNHILLEVKDEQV